jgi:hypothetical protein
MSEEKIVPGSDEECRLLARWIKKAQGLIVASSAMGESFLDPKIKREEGVQKLSEEYVELDHKVAIELPHLKGRYRWDLEKYFRENFGSNFPKED